MIGVLIADEHVICREALRTLFERESGFLVVGEAADGEEALEQVVLRTPDVMLLDMMIPRATAVDVLRRLKESAIATPVLILAECLDAGVTVESLRLGARGVVLKESTPEILFKSIRAVAEGEYWIGRKVIGDLIRALQNGTGSANSDRHSARFSLTPRELEIVAEVAEGCTNKYIAEKLSIAEQTVKHHLTSIFQKVGVSNRLELAVFAMHRGIHNGP